MMPRFMLQWCFRSEISAMAPSWQRWSRELCVLGAVLVALVPAARSHHEWLGWLPLWLLAMPLLACWVAHGLPLPRRSVVPGSTPGSSRYAVSLRRSETVQARRRRGFGQAVTSGRSRRSAACASVRGQ